MTQVTKKSGFQSLLNQRAAMHSWATLQTLLSHGSNREAAAIVESFQLQMDCEQSDEQLLAA